MKTSIFAPVLLAFVTNVVADKTTCMSDYESSEGLQYICFCDDSRIDVSRHAKDIYKDKGFSLSEFAFNLAGNYFSKSVVITFQSCKNLKVKLDHLELSRIGSDFFRPDIQVKSINIEQVYHLELLRSKSNGAQDYLYTFPDHNLTISLRGVALVKLDAGATFNSMKTTSSASRLYIDLNQGRRGDEDNLNIKGFKSKNIFFITKKEKIQLEEGEDLDIKMKQLSLEQLTTQTQELSFALTIFAVVIMIGILGLAAVVVHRQKKKRQLKALLRAKNLGPVLETREIAQGISKKYNLDNRLPRYTQVRKPSIVSLGATQAEIPAPNVQPNADKSSKRIDVNEFISAILYRTRKGEYRTGLNTDSPKTVPKKPLPETSFYYRESSLSDTSDARKQVVADADIHHEDGEDDHSSYVSKISQQVFIDSRTSRCNTGARQRTQQDLKDRFLTFFSSVSKTNGNELTKTKL